MGAVTPSLLIDHATATWAIVMPFFFATSSTLQDEMSARTEARRRGSFYRLTMSLVAGLVKYTFESLQDFSSVTIAYGGKQLTRQWLFFHSRVTPRAE